jgi:hypothetical protein
MYICCGGTMLYVDSQVATIASRSWTKFKIRLCTGRRASVRRESGRVQALSKRVDDVQRQTNSKCFKVSPGSGPISARESPGFTPAACLHRVLGASL